MTRSRRKVLDSLQLTGLFLVVGCAPERDGLPACNRSDRTGTYLVEYIELSGTCGPLPDELAQFENGRNISDGTTAPVCTDQTRTWSDDECTIAADYTCTTADAVFSWETTTEQLTSNGSELAGTGSVRRTELDGTVVCSGTYDVVATRQ